METGPPVDEPKGMKRSIIIGLGGTGMEVVMRLRGQLLEHYGSFDDIPIVRFLVIDTDTGYELTERSLIKSSTALEEDERVDAIVADPRPIYAGIERGAHPYIGEWFSLEHLRGITNIQDGAGQVRQLGRLCLFHKYNEIKACLLKTRESLSLVDAADYMRERHDVEVDPGINIYIVASIAGGTGGGMFLDMAYIIKHLIPTSNSAPRRVMGYIIMPQAFAGLGDRIEANGYAALMELNYHSYTGDPSDRQYPLFGRPRFQAQYSESDADRIGGEGQEPPFDYTYLVSNSTAQGVKLKRGEIFEMVARNLMLDFTSKFAQWKRSLRDNIRPVTLHPDTLGCPVRYMTFGLSSIMFPVERVREACAYHLAVSLASRWRQEIEDAELLRATSDAINKYVETFLDELEMVESAAHRRHQLISPICLAQSGQPLQNVANEWKAYVASLPDQQQWDFKAWFDRLSEEEARFRRRFDDSNPNPEGWGPYFRRMYDNMVQQVEQRKKQLSAAIADMVEDEHRGPKYAELFIDQLCQKFEDYKTELDRTAGSAQAIAAYLGDVKVQGAVQGSGIALDNMLEQAMEQNLHEIRKVATSAMYILNRREAMRRQMMEYLGWASSFFRAKIEIKARYLGRDLVDGLIAHLQQLRRSVLELRTVLRQLCDRLEAIEGEYLQTTDVIVINGELIYSRELVQALYREFVPETEEHNTLMQLLDWVLTDDDLVEPGQRLRLIDVPRRCAADPAFLEKLRKTLAKRAEVFFRAQTAADRGIEQITVAHLLRQQYPNDQKLIDEMLEPIYARSQPFLPFLAALERGGWTEDPRQRARLVGIEGGATASDPDVQRIVDALSTLPGVSRQDHIKPIPERNIIIFTHEEGGFPLRRIQGVDRLRTAYEQLSRRRGESPLHIRAQADMYPDVYPITDESLQESHQAQLLGRALGMIEQQGTDGVYIFNYKDPATGVELPRILGSDEQGAMLTLTRETELRQSLLDTVHRTVQDASPERKKEIAQRLSAFLADAASQFPQGRLDRTYQDKYHTPVVQFMSQHGLSVEA